MLDNWKNSDYSIIIVDRWYESYDNLTNECISEIESSILEYNFTIVRIFLYIPDNIVYDRLMYTKKHRKDEWWEGYSHKSIDELIYDECIYQQVYKQFCKKNNNCLIEICTSDMNWGIYEKSIIDYLYDKGILENDRSFN